MGGGGMQRLVLLPRLPMDSLCPAFPATLFATHHAALVSSWVRADGDSKLAAALQELSSLHLLARVARGGQAAWALNAHFQAQLRHAMCSGWVGVALLLVGHAGWQSRCLNEGQACINCS